MFNSLIGSIGTVTNEFEALIKEKHVDAEKLVYLIKVNHKILQSLQLSVPMIDKLTLIADKHKVGIKITGAGCGGCLLAVYSPHSEVDKFKAALLELKDEGVKLIEAAKNDQGFKLDTWEVLQN